MILQTAQKAAEHIVKILAPHCERIDVGGSVRRKKNSVKDIEIVCTPKMINPTRRSSGFCKAIFDLGRIMKSAKKLNTAKYIQVEFVMDLTPEPFIDEVDGIEVEIEQTPTFEYIDIDIFVADPENYGMTLFIRTGSAEYVRMIFGKFNKKGYKSKDGIHQDTKSGELLKFKNEDQIFEFLDMHFAPPEKRRI